MYRANTAQAAAFLYFVIFLILGLDGAAQAEKFVTEGEPANPELAQAVLEPATIAKYIHAAGRAILLLYSIKNLNVTKTYIYYEILQRIIEQFLVRESTLGSVMWSLIS